MSLYSIAVFLHVLGMLGLFIALGIERMILSNLAQSTGIVEARAWIRSSSNLPALALSSIVLIVLSGIYLAARIRAWPIAWIQVSLVAVIVIGVLGALVGTRLRAMRKIAADDSGASLDTYRHSVADAALQTPIRTRLTTALAIVLLMVTRPDRNTSLVIIGGALAIGLLWSVPTWNRRPVKR
jgi:signal transduction histidine kinase